MVKDPYPFKLITLSKQSGLSDISAADHKEIGGKAAGLLQAYSLITKLEPADFSGVQIRIPEMVVIGTSVFDAFMQRNQLSDIAFSRVRDNRIAHAFQQASMPFEVLGDLRNLLGKWTMPLAIRSSGLLEDTLQQPFAGVYQTKMIPNNDFPFENRFQKLIEAIKYVWASTYFAVAKDYCRATNADIRDEKMAVIIQQLVGKRYGNRYYPELSGVTRSYNFYPFKPAQPQDGVVNLVLGLGKTVVDGGKTWTYSPKYPKSPPPFKSINELVQQTQTEFWAVNMSGDYDYNPIKETEYLQHENIITAEKDGALANLVSTFDLQNERLAIGQGLSGPPVLTFAPILQLETVPLNRLILMLLRWFELPVEIEFAQTFDPPVFNFLQVRPMKISNESYQISKEEMTDPHVLISTQTVLGNGVLTDVEDIIYVKRDNFNLKFSRQIAKELENHNNHLLEENRNYILIVFGRLGSLDPWLGIPVTWGQIGGARVIVETSQENFPIELSQGSHYFHNIINLDVKYFSVPSSQPIQINWEWLENQEVVKEYEFTRHVRSSKPLMVKVDGKTGQGIILTN